MPIAKSPIAQMVSLISGKRPEYIDPKITSKNEGREGKIKVIEIDSSTPIFDIIYMIFIKRFT